MEQIATKHNAIKGHIHLPLFMLAEIKECGFFNDLTRNVITKEMQQLKVPFYFWENKEFHNWEYTSLMGDDKETTTDPMQLKQQARDWLSLFLTPSQEDPTNPRTFVQGLYMPSQATLYIHALVYHGWELLKKHQKWGLKSFSYSAVKKKNYNQVSTFFRKTLKNGGNALKRKSAIQEIIEYENRKEGANTS
ncbi:hypothetical protein C1646_764283 [Rhizophagus diaphanus]|nr:hypothetical protein C1646_764283 [Rhizophagus diaphanus] [Rhizophagus sp. MUCL 43196]